MDDLAGMVSELLKDPQALEQIKGLSGLLGQTSKPQETSTKSVPAAPQPDLSILPPDAMQTVVKLMPLLSSMNKEDDTTRFIKALRPLLSDKRKTKLDEAAKMLHMMKVLPLLKKQGIF